MLHTGRPVNTEKKRLPPTITGLQAKTKVNGLPFWKWI